MIDAHKFCCVLADDAVADFCFVDGNYWDYSNDAGGEKNRVFFDEFFQLNVFEFYREGGNFENCLARYAGQNSFFSGAKGVSFKPEKIGISAFVNPSPAIG